MRTEKIQELRKLAMALPLHPGVYLMKDREGTVIYVGKAKALKNRVSQYFGSDTNHSEKVRQMVAHVDHFDTILADSEFEALVLECSLIKQYSPKYNILLKDDKGYSYIRISPPPYSRLQEVKQTQKDGAKYLGPYMSSYAVKQAVDEACKVFGLATCNRQFAYRKKPLATERPCLNYHIKQCCGPCTGKISEKEYAERVAGAVKLLKDGTQAMCKTLEKQMTDAAENLDFEKAAMLRDRIAAIRRMDSKQKVVHCTYKEEDVLAVVSGEGQTCVQVLRFTDYKLCKKEEFFFPQTEDPKALRAEFLCRFYEGRNRIPSRVVLDGETEDMELLRQLLTQNAGHKVSLLIPKRGEQAELVSMCARNATENLAKRVGMFGHEMAILEELQSLLGMDSLPKYIECYDISHTAGEDPVAGMVVFENGKPNKKAYKKFKIKTATGGDDPGAMREVLSRRLNEYSEHEGEDGFGRIPDLILLDGGMLQVSAVAPLVEAFGWNSMVCGLVKDGHHRTRALVEDGREIMIQSKRMAFTLLASIQEEVHRYAIGFHRQSRGKRSLYTVLTGIEGVGKKRAEILLKQFGSVRAIEKATKEQLLSVKGITEPVAEQVAAYFAKKRETE